MRTEYLEYLLEVAHTNSISRAAKKLFIGQTTLSAIINSVENELNIKIFLRTHRGVKLTERGEQVIAIAEDMVKKNRQLHNLCQDMALTRRNISLVAYPSACNILGLYLSDKIQKETDAFTLTMQETPSEKVLSGIVNGAANIGIGASARYEFFNHQYTAHNNGFLFEPLYTDRFCLCVSGDSHLAGRKTVDVSELEKEHLAATSAHPSSSTMTVGCLFKYVRCFSVFNNMEVVKKAVLEQNVVAALPSLSYYGDELVASGKLCLLELTGFETELTNFLVVNQKNGLNKHEEKLIELIREFYRKLELPVSGAPDDSILIDSEDTVQ